MLAPQAGLPLPEAFPSFLVDAILSQIVSCTQIQSGQVVPTSDSLRNRRQQAQNPGHAASGCRQNCPRGYLLSLVSQEDPPQSQALMARSAVLAAVRPALRFNPKSNSGLIWHGALKRRRCGAPRANGINGLADPVVAQWPCFLNVGVIKSMNDCYFHVLPSNLVECRSGQKARTTRFLTAVAFSSGFGAREGEGLSAMWMMNRAAPGGM
jgi:hypothetical protein